MTFVNIALLFLHFISRISSSDFGLPEIVLVDQQSGQIQDEYKRSRIFHGVNVVFKEFPYYPNLDTFHPRWSFSKEDVDILADLGLNAIRLDVSWAGAEPIRGAYNETFFQQIHRIVDMCEKRGIYVLLEFHQDLFSERYCGNGAPIWASRPISPNNPFRFPFPAMRPFKVNTQDYTADLQDCKKMDNHLLGYMNYGVSQAFQDLYNNRDGLLESFTNYWRKVVKEFKHQRNILGYELINEPWVGQYFKNPLLLLGKSADKNILQPMYDTLEEAIRSIDKKRLIFFESCQTDMRNIGFTKTPGGFKSPSKSVFAWHYYWNVISKKSYFDLRFKESRDLGAASFATEFDISWDGTLRRNRTLDEGGKQLNDTLDSMKRFDEKAISWLGWEYKTYVRKTGWGAGLFNENTGMIRSLEAKIYARPYARAVTGRITHMEYNDESRCFMLRWVIPAHSNPNYETEVFLSKRWHYPDGYDIIVSPETTFRKEGDLLFLANKKKNQSQEIALLIRPK